MPRNFCVDTSNIWRMVGYFLLVFKIVIPIILIILKNIYGNVIDKGVMKAIFDRE